MKAMKLTVGVAFLLLGLTLAGQSQKQKGQQADRFEKAHEGIFSQPNKAAEASRLTVTTAAALPRTGKAGKVVRRNFVDNHIFGRIERDRIPHAPLAGDEEFLRRAYLDATGMLPAPEVIRQFLANKDPRKREKLIDSLIGTDEFAEQWAWFYGDLFRTRNESFHFWNKQWLKVDRPYNDVLYDLITTTGKTHTMMPALHFYEGSMYNASRAPSPTDADNYFLMNRLDFIDEATVDIGRIFLGINLDCVSCHDGAGHTDSINLFLTDKTRKDFHRQAAFYGKLRTVIGYNDRILNVSGANTIMDNEAPGYNTGNDAPFHTEADTRFPRNGELYEPTFILTGEKPKPGEDPRKALARIIPTHVQFSRATANLIWSKLMVVGFVEPYDGFDLNRMDPGKPPEKPWTVQQTNPELLEALAADFQKNKFSLHHLIKTIMKSSAYQLSTQFDGEWKDTYIPYYARRFVRVMTGPEVADSVAMATDRHYDFELLGEKVTRVKQLATPGGVRGPRRPGLQSEGTAIYALMQAFYQSTRETPAFQGNKASPVQAMLMMASPVITNRVTAEKGSRLARLLESVGRSEQIVEELFLASLSRMPSASEMEVALQLMERDRRRGAENIQWALLNSAEFLLNH